MKTKFLLGGLAGVLGLATLASAAEPAAGPTKNPAAAAGEAVGIARRDGITVSGNEAFVTLHGVTEMLIRDLELPSGVVVHPDSTISRADHSPMSLLPDQMFTFDGTLFTLPPDPTVNPAPPPPRAPVAATPSDASGQPTPTPAAGADTIRSSSVPTIGGGSGSVFFSSDGTPFVGTITSPGTITTTIGNIVLIDGSIRALSLGANGSSALVGQLNANGTIQAGNGALIFPDGSIRNIRGTILSPAAPGRGAAVAPGMLNVQGVVTQQVTSIQQAIVKPQATSIQQGLATQLGVARPQGNITLGAQGHTPVTTGNAGGGMSNAGASMAGGARR